MDSTDTATIELTREEARAVINALSGQRVVGSEREDQRALDVRELLQREFGFDWKGGGIGSVADVIEGIFEDGSDTNELRLSRAEAEAVLSALADREATSGSGQEATIEVLRQRFEATFGLPDDG